MKKLLLSSLTLCALLSSCTKEDKKSGSSSATAKTIADKKWQLSAHVFTYMGVENNGYALLSDCQKDNLMTFKSDNTNELDEGATKCSSSAPQTRVEGKWELRAGDTEIFLSDLSSSSPYGISQISLTIIEATSSTLKVKYTTDVNGPVIENIATYTAK